MEYALSRVIDRIKGRTDYRETKIIKRVKISYDGKQFLVRMPTEIAKLFEIQQGQYLEFSVDVPYVQEKKEKIAVITVRQ